MSTRANIGFYPSKDSKLNEYDALVYKHSDGYPEGVLELLTAFCISFNDKRGLNDSEYASAWYIWELCQEQVENRPGGYLGVGVSKRLHGDIDYYYAVFPDRVETYSTKYSTPFVTEQGELAVELEDINFNLIQTFTLI